jgi:hypothetical protein
VTQDSNARSHGAVNVIAVGRLSLNLGARHVLARVRTTPCDECSQPIRWWHRRVWLVNGDRCMHLQCWKGQVFLNEYIQLMAEELRHSAPRRSTSSDNGFADDELQELRASARTLRERVERLEAQLQQAEEIAAQIQADSSPSNGKLS